MTAYEARKRLVDKALTFVGTTEGSIVHKWLVDEYNKIDPLCEVGKDGVLLGLLCRSGG